MGWPSGSCPRAAATGEGGGRWQRGPQNHPERWAHRRQDSGGLGSKCKFKAKFIKNFKR